MTVVSPDHGAIHIPAWVVDEDSFRRWKTSDEFPRHVPIRFENGDVVVDLRPKLPSRVFFIHDRFGPPPAREFS